LWNSPRNSMIKHAIEVHTMHLSDGMEPVGMVSNFPGKNRLALRCLAKELHDQTCNRSPHNATQWWHGTSGHGIQLPRKK
jgi:hypothetical protein